VTNETSVEQDNQVYIFTRGTTLTTCKLRIPLCYLHRNLNGQTVRAPMSAHPAASAAADATKPAEGKVVSAQETADLIAGGGFTYVDVRCAAAGCSQPCTHEIECSSTCAAPAATGHFVIVAVGQCFATGGMCTPALNNDPMHQPNAWHAAHIR
jgi:hypothetical protein